MMGPIINAGLIITLFTIAAPFVFVLLVIRMFTGSDRRERRRDYRAERRHRRSQEVNNGDLDEIAKGLKDLNKRIDNLETIRKYKRDKE